MTNRIYNVTMNLCILASFCIGCIGLVIIAFNGCTPRSATMCLKNNVWVKCPKGVKVGTDLDDFKRTKNDSTRY